MARPILSRRAAINEGLNDAVEQQLQDQDDWFEEKEDPWLTLEGEVASMYDLLDLADEREEVLAGDEDVGSCYFDDEPWPELRASGEPGVADLSK
jgi:hypothetical protein